MPEKLLYEYAVVRYIPNIEREEFVNIGLIMMCKRSRWIRLQFSLDADRISHLKDCLPTGSMTAQLESMMRIADGKKDGGEIAAFPVEERFRWLTAVRSTCIQTSRPHPGLTDNLDQTFATLYKALVD